MKASIKYEWLVFLIISIMVIGFPRFNRLDRFGIDQYTSGGRPAAIALSDSEYYTNHVLYFRGEVGAEKLKEPFVYRPLPAYVASFLPFSAMTSINIINYTAVIVGLFFLLKILSFFGFSPPTVLIGGFLYTFSFPNFYYATVGCIDSILVCWLMISYYLILTKNMAIFFILFLLGAFVKETYIIILPVLLTHLWLVRNYSFIKSASICFLLAGVFLCLIATIRVLTPVPSGFLWAPKPGMIFENLGRYRSWLSFGLTLGPGGLLATYYLIKKNFKLLDEPQALVLAVGFIAAFSVFVFSMFSAWADGRFFWISYPFMIPLACFVIDRLVNKNLSGVRPV